MSPGTTFPRCLLTVWSDVGVVNMRELKRDEDKNALSASSVSSLSRPLLLNQVHDPTPVTLVAGDHES